MLNTSCGLKKKMESRIFDKKKSSGLKNTTLEEISEAQSELISPSKQGRANFIQRNINYVNKLNQIIKDKKTSTEKSTMQTTVCVTTRHVQIKD